MGDGQGDSVHKEQSAKKPPLTAGSWKLFGGSEGKKRERKLPAREDAKT